jgi:hypothetical protein
MGLGLGWLTRLMVEGTTGALRVPAAALATILSLFISVWPVKGHWETHDRRGNWVAHDYARNMLRALEPSAVLFTNGDNDTFPLWYLQEVEGFRTDVRVVNLSLLNTPWYAQQLRNERPHPDAEPVPMGLSNEEIADLRPFRDQHGEIHLVKDQVAMDIVNEIYTSGSDRPIYFAVTVDDLLELDDYLKLEGLVFRLTPGDKNVPGAADDSTGIPGDLEAAEGEPVVIDNVNLTATRRNLEEVYTYRGLLTEDGKLDLDIYRDDNERKLVTNYAAAWARMALAYRSIGNYDEAIACLQRAIEVAPEFDPISGGLGSMLLEAGRFEEAREVFLERLETHPDDIAVYMGLGYTAINADNWEEALEWYLRGIRVDPSSRDMLAGMYQAFVRLERYSEAENVLLRWLQVHPNDQSAKNALADVRRLMKEESPSGASSGG